MQTPNTPEQSPLGQATLYHARYDPDLLFPMARAPKRQELGIDARAPFLGADLWTAYELSWLNQRGKPQVAIADITIPCESPNILESKSLKLYLGSLSNHGFPSMDAVQATLHRDLGAALWAGADTEPSAVGVRLLTPDQFSTLRLEPLTGLSLDRLDIDCHQYTPTPALLQTVPGEAPIAEVLTSELLKSNCLVTGQPDWGSVQITYEGDAIDHAGLLRYLVSYRNHSEFHEQCVERIFMDIWTRCRPLKLSVYARYTRRGGLDINPFRTSHPQRAPQNVRTARQ